MPKISALPSGTTLAGTEALPIVQSSATVKSTPSAIRTYIAPLTTKGDVLTFGSANARLGVGTDGQVLTASSGATNGIAWEDQGNVVPVRGLATLSSGTKQVNTSHVTTNSIIFLTVQTLGTVTAPQALYISARSAGASFTVTSADATDTSIVGWAIFEPNAIP